MTVASHITTFDKGDHVADRPIVSELSRLIHKGVRLVSIKESIRFEGKQNLQTKAVIVLFGLFAEIKRDLIVERTKEGLAAARARGKSKLDGKEDDIRTFLTKGVSKASIARIMEVSPTTLHYFVRTRRLQARTASPR